jgi:uncharacterized protein YprB with RNaseH-like and TPR domain
MTLELVAFDIETTGFTVDDTVTVAGFVLPLGCRVFCQTDGRDASNLEARVQEHATGEIMLSTHADEAALLEAMQEFAAMRLRDDDVLLVAFNGETWRGGFDLPFLRTRYSRQELAWPFTNLPYADLLPLFDDQFNTTVGEDSHADLAGVYETLCEAACTPDPFEDSGEAVDAFETGAFVELVQHNVADIQRTQALGRLAERYCSKSDFNLKSLTATVED